MAKVTRVKYFTQDKLDLRNKDNIKLYEKYLKSNILKDKSVENTTYKVYQNYFNHFLVYLAEEWGDIGLYDKEFFTDAIDIMEGYMSFCLDTLLNNKKVINTKISTVSSFYCWSVKRKLVDFHPFDGKITRMQGASDERITKDYFLTDDQVEKIAHELENNEKFDIQDRILFHLAMDSANRVGALSKITLSSLDLENGLFENIREKRGKMVEIVFEDVCKAYIEKWLEDRKELDNLEIDSLFITFYRGKYRPMAYGTLQSKAKRFGAIVGIEDFHMHCLRKSSIDRLMRLTGDIEMAKQHANHKSTDTTLLYIKPKSKTEIREKLRELRKKAKVDKDDLAEE
jgi:integrase/recombinase XerC